MNFWLLSRVCVDLKLAAEAEVSTWRRLGGDASAACLRRRTSLAEPAVPLARLFRHAVRITTLDLSGAHWWLKGPGGAFAVARAISAAPFAGRLEALRLDRCEGLDDAAVARLVVAEDEPRDAPCQLPSPPRPFAALGALPALRELSLRSCPRVASAAFLFHVPRLARLDVAWCRHMRIDLAMEGFVRDLVALDATGVEWAGNNLIARLPPRVRELRVAMAPLSDAGLLRLAQGAGPELRTLELARRAQNLWADGLFTDAGVAELRRARPEVEIVFVSA